MIQPSIADGDPAGPHNVFFWLLQWCRERRVFSVSVGLWMPHLPVVHWWHHRCLPHLTNTRGIEGIGEW